MAKKEEIKVLFASIGFQTFVSLDMIWDEKWLNATVTLSKIEEQMKSRMYQIGSDVLTINNLPEFSFEAMEVYKSTLDVNRAIQEGQRLAGIQKRKLEAERIKKEQEIRKEKETAEQEEVVTQSITSVPTYEAAQETVEEVLETQKEEPVLQLDFRVWGTKEQLMALRNYMKENHLKFGKVE